MGTTIAVVAALAAVALAIFTLIMLMRMKKQMKQYTDHALTHLHIEQNWKLFDHKTELPPALPPWRGLSPKGWAWRILHLNHLNLLSLAYRDHDRGLLRDEELESWIRMGKFWFSLLREETTDEEIKEGRQRLREVLMPQEGYSREFRQWLRDKRIISQNLFPQEEQ